MFFSSRKIAIYVCFYALLCSSNKVLAFEDHDFDLFSVYYKKANNKRLDESTRMMLLKKAFIEAHTFKSDSAKYWSFSKIAVAASSLKDSLFSMQVLDLSHNLAKGVNRKDLLADAHWNYAIYYLHRNNYELSYLHYNNAYKLFTAIDNSYLGAKMLYNMAYISSRVFDYTSAESLLYKAIEIFEPLKKYKQLYLCYNLLGSIADNLEEYDEAFKNYNLAYSYLDNLSTPKYHAAQYYNNLGLVYHKQGRFKTAIKYFNRGLRDTSLEFERPDIYAKLIDNKAYSRLQIGLKSDVYITMLRALSIRDSIEDVAGVVINLIHLAHYFTQERDTVSALNYASMATSLAKRNGLNRDILSSLLLLSTLDTAMSKEYLQEYIALSKELAARERSIRNKFAAIRFETDKYILENQRLFKERFYIQISGLILLVIFLLIYWSSRQRAKHKALLFEREQQQYNEDMFLLALENKTIMERGRNLERLRISEELHDGILSRLFATRFKWGFISLQGEPEALKLHNTSINELVSIEAAIRNLSHDLKNDLIWDELNFVDELENNLREKSEIGAFKYSVKADRLTDWNNLKFLRKLNISRILDEILQNIIKHSNSTHVKVDFTIIDDFYTLTIEDNGKGFKVHAKHKGIGLKNIRDRVKVLNGTLAIVSELGIGTIIKISIPKKS